jgi:hypothetical protein
LNDRKQRPQLVPGSVARLNGIKNRNLILAKQDEKEMNAGVDRVASALHFCQDAARVWAD